MHFVVEESGEGSVTAGPKAREGAPGIGRKQACLRAVPAPDRLDSPFRTRAALVVGDDVFADALTAAGWTAWRTQEDVPGDADLDLVVHVGGTLTSALLLARDTQQRLERAAAKGRAAFLVVTRLDGLLGFDGVDRGTALLGGLPGLVKTLAIEAPSVFCRAVDLAPSLPDERCAELLLAELHDAQPNLPDVAYDAAGTRRTVGLSDDRDDLMPSGPAVGSPVPATCWSSPAGAVASPRPAWSSSRAGTARTCFCWAAPNSPTNPHGRWTYQPSGCAPRSPRS